MHPVPPIAAHGLLVLLLQVGLLLLLAVAAGGLARLCRMPAVVGELAAGVLIGPSVFGHLLPAASGWLLPQQSEQFHMLDAIGQLGVLLLVGITGMQMDLKLVRRRIVGAAGISAGGLLVPLGLGIGLGYLLPGSFLAWRGNRELFALFLGVALCVSAIPVIAKTLSDLNMLHRNVGQLTLTAGMVDDAAGWVLLSLVSAMAASGVGAGDVGLAVLKVVAVVGGAVLLGPPLVRTVFRFIPPHAVQPFSVVLLLLGAAGTQALGLEAVFGAFLAGILIGGFSGWEPAAYAPARTVTLTILAPIFFATAGLRMDLTALRDRATLLGGLAILAVAILGKFTGVYGGARWSRMNRWEALALSAGMNARGVIEVVVAMVGLRLGILNTATYTIVILVAIVTSLMAPPILRLAMARVEQTAEEMLRKHEQGASAPIGRSEPHIST